MNASPEGSPGPADGSGSGRGSGAGGSPRRRVVSLALRYGVGLLAAGFAFDVVFGRRDELAGAIHLFGNISVPWAVLALVAEVLSIVCYAGLQRCLLQSGGADIGLRPLTGVTLAADAIQNSLPIGPAWSTVYAYRQYRARGADSVVAGWTLVFSTVVAFATLGVIALVGLALSQGKAAADDLIEGILVSAVVAALLVTAAQRGVLVGPLYRLALGGVRLSQWIIRRPHGEPEHAVADAMHRIETMRLSRGVLLRAFAWASGNWLLDLSCLAMGFIAVHSAIPWRGLLLAYGAGQLASNLPLTLGGLGVVEGSLTIALVFYGGAQSATVAAVLLYRIISFWLLLPAGWTAALVLRLRRRVRDCLEVVSS